MDISVCFKLGDSTKKVDSSILRQLKNIERERDSVFFRKSPLELPILTMKDYGKVRSDSLAENQTPRTCKFER